MKPLAALALAAALADSVNASDIYYNQLGFYPELPKNFAVADSEATSFELVEVVSGQAVLSGELSAATPYADAGVSTRSGSISSWSAPGEYRLRLSDGTVSANFAIGERIHGAALRAALKSFYFNRSSSALEATHAGAYARPAGHPDTAVRFHSSTGRADGTAASPGGWYDAGDYGKYIVNGGFALGTLLALHELHPDAIGDDTSIPESGNGVSDLLDECRWELEWFLTMQDADGGVFHKLTTLSFVGFVMPHETTTQRYFIGKSTAATLNFAAVTAQAARIYASIDDTFATLCLEASERAWDWATAHPAVYFSNPNGVSTGEYGDSNVSDEFVWAAAQLLLSGSEAAGLSERLAGSLAAPALDTAAGWGSTRNLGLYALATDDSPIAETERERIRSAITTKAEAILAAANANPIGVPMAANEFFWGSNGHIASKGVLLAYAHAISQDPRYLLGMQTIADYLLGRNATGYSFLTGYGAKSPLFIHHRPSGADGIDAPVPGFLAGGPNASQQDGVAYPHPEPARSYADVTASYASNEIAINWNAPFVFLLGALETAAANGMGAIQPGADAYRFAADGENFVVDAAEGTLANDAYPLGGSGPLRAALEDAPALGQLALAADGSFTFQPPSDFVGNLYFSYRANTDTTTSEPAIVTLSVHPANGTSFPESLRPHAALWLDAAAIDTEDWAQYDPSTKKVLLWQDLSDGARDATNANAASQPTLAADAHAGLPMLRFGPGAASLAIGDIRAEAGDVTAFIVSLSDTTEGDGFQRLITGYTGVGNNWEAPNYFVSRPHLDNNQPHAYGAEITLQRDTDRSLSNLLVGGQAGGVNAFQGLIGEILLFARALDDGEVALVEAYLADKWRLWDTLPPTHTLRRPNGYDAWMWNYPALTGDDAAPDADPNGNGIANAFEYLFARDPTAINAARDDPLFQLGMIDGALALTIRSWNDYPLRGFDLLSNMDLSAGNWSPSDADGGVDFQLVATTPTATDGVSLLRFAPVSPSPDQFFLTLQVE